jgi:hypothetical protein
MKEDQGRPEPVAFQFGHLDAPQDVRKPSLCPVLYLLSPDFASSLNFAPYSSVNRINFPRLFTGAYQPKASAPPQVVGEHHENVSGK